MTSEQFSNVLWEIASAQMAIAEGFLDDADIHMLRAMRFLKESEEKEWPEWIASIGTEEDRKPLPKRVSMQDIGNVEEHYRET